MKTKITLRNDFHGTSINLVVNVDEDGKAILSERQLLRARNALCMRGCACSGFVGTRGYQHDVLWIDPFSDNGTNYNRAEIKLRGY